MYQISDARVTVAVPRGRSNMMITCLQFKFDGQQQYLENGHLTRDTSQIYSLTYLSKTDKIRFAHYRIWRQIDIIGYLNRSTSSKFVSASFKSFTFGAECISM